MRFRKLRIAWSVVCVIATLLLIALWVRSSYWTDYAVVQDSASRLIAVDVAPGTLSIRIGATTTPNRWGNWKYTRRLGLWREYFGDTGTPRLGRLLGNFNVSRGSSSALNASAPFWFVAPLLITLASVPWIRHLKWHFSLRTMLIATTLMAVALGLVVYSLDK